MQAPLPAHITRTLPQVAKELMVPIYNSHVNYEWEKQLPTSMIKQIVPTILHPLADTGDLRFTYQSVATLVEWAGRIHKHRPLYAKKLVSGISFFGQRSSKNCVEIFLHNSKQVLGKGEEAKAVDCIYIRLNFKDVHNTMLKFDAVKVAGNLKNNERIQAAAIRIQIGTSFPKAKTIAQCRSVGVFQGKRHPKFVFFMQKYKEGSFLKFHVKCWNALTSQAKLQLIHLFALQTLTALVELNRAGFVHRDVKFDNILVSSTEPKSFILTDFGHAVSIKPNDPRWDKIGGTPLYSPPERFCQWYGCSDEIFKMLGIKNQEQTCTVKIDSWCLGIALYRLIFNTFPPCVQILMSLEKRHNQIEVVREGELKKTEEQIQAEVIANWKVEILNLHNQKEPFPGPMGSLIWDLMRPNPAARISATAARITLLHALNS